MFTSDQLAEAARQWQYFPYRRCWVAHIDGQCEVILKSTAHYATDLRGRDLLLRSCHANLLINPP